MRKQKGEKPSDSPKFNEEVDKIKTFCEKLTEEERQELFADDGGKFDVEEYRNMFYEGYGTEDAIIRAKEFLEVLQEDLEGIHIRKDLQEKQLTIPRLLARFIKLPNIFKSYLKLTVIIESEKEACKGAKFEFDGDCDEDMSDEVFARILTVLELSSSEKTKYLKKLAFTLRLFDRKLTEIEDALKTPEQLLEEAEIRWDEARSANLLNLQIGSPTGTHGYRANDQVIEL